MTKQALSRSQQNSMDT